MPLPPLTVTLSDGQKLEALKRYRTRYHDELRKVEAEIMVIRTELLECDFLIQYLGEQPEVVELRKNKDKLEALERRRAHVGMLVERLDGLLPTVVKAESQAPAGALRRF